MRVMALDVGSKRIGIAISDLLRITAQGLETFHRTDDLAKDIQRIWQLIADHEVSELVIGLPKNMNGSLGFKAEEVQEFAAQLMEGHDMKVTWIDERLTTVSAERILLEGDVSRKKRKGVIDKMAATIILQSYLDRF